MGVVPVVLVLFGALLVYSGLHDMSPTDVLRVALGRQPQDQLGSIAPGGTSSGGSSSDPNFSGAHLGAGKGAYSKLHLGRLDQGVDFSGSGPVGAIADGKVIHVGLWPGWPGDGGVVYSTRYGNIYVMEHFHPSVKVGDTVKAGQVIGYAPGGYPYIETGFANSAGTGPLTPYNGAPDGTPMSGAKRFKQLLGL